MEGNKEESGIPTLVTPNHRAGNLSSPPRASVSPYSGRGVRGHLSPLLILLWTANILPRLLPLRRPPKTRLKVSELDELLKSSRFQHPAILSSVRGLGHTGVTRLCVLRTHPRKWQWPPSHQGHTTPGPTLRALFASPPRTLPQASQESCCLDEQKGSEKWPEVTYLRSDGTKT